MTKQVSQLEELDIKSVGLVGSPANHWKFALFKKEKTMPEDVKKNDAATLPVEDVATPADTTDDETKLADRVKGVLREMFKGKMAGAEAAPESEPIEPVEPVTDVGALFKAQTERLEKIEKDLADAREDVATEKALRKNAEYLTKAESYAVPGKISDLAELLQKADAAGLGEAFEAVLEGASAAIIQSGAFIERGSQENVGATDFMGLVTARAAELQKSGDIAEHVAITKALKEISRENPELARDHVATRQDETGGRS